MRSAELAAAPEHRSDSQLATELAVLEIALDGGDLKTVRRQVRALRRCLEPTSGAAAEPPPPRLRLVGGVPLTGREISALHLLTDGSMSQKDMARELGVSTNTIKTHLKSLYLKLGAHCRGEAIQRGRDFGILPTNQVGTLASDVTMIERTGTGG